MIEFLKMTIKKQKNIALIAHVSNRSLSQVISADYFRRKRLSQSAVDDADAHYIG